MALCDVAQSGAKPPSREAANAADKPGMDPLGSSLMWVLVFRAYDAPYGGVYKMSCK